jgi:hypothetical protein
MSPRRVSTSVVKKSLLHDHDTKFTKSFRAIIASGQVEPLALPARSPNLNDLDEERCVQCHERLRGLLRYYHQEAA